MGIKITELGSSGLKVSNLGLGCMGMSAFYGETNEEESLKTIDLALDLGINFFDTANVYSIGRSEEIIGKALKDFAKRDEVVLATKVHGKMHEGPNGSGLSRKSIMSEIDKSLKRLTEDMTYNNTI